MYAFYLSSSSLPLLSSSFPYFLFSSSFLPSSFIDLPVFLLSIFLFYQSSSLLLLSIFLSSSSLILSPLWTFFLSSSFPLTEKVPSLLFQMTSVTLANLFTPLPAIYCVSLFNYLNLSIKYKLLSYSCYKLLSHFLNIFLIISMTIITYCYILISLIWISKTYFWQKSSASHRQPILVESPQWMMPHLM